MKHFYEGGNALSFSEQRRTFSILRNLKNYLYSFKCLLLSLSTYCYQFSCNAQESRASGATGYAARLIAALAHAIQVLRTVYTHKRINVDTCLTHERHNNHTCLTHERHMNDTTNCVKEVGIGNEQAGVKQAWSMASVLRFSTLLIHCYYFTHTWLILRPYTKVSKGRDEVGIKRGYSRDIVLFVQQLHRMLGFLKEYFRGAMEGLCHYVGNDGRISRLGLLTIFCVLFSSLAFMQASAQTQAGLVLRGEVRSAADGQAIEGATISVDNKNAHTDKEGRFTISVVQPQGVVAIKHIGYQELSLAYANTSSTLQVKLEPSDRQIEEVEVISTGYQQLPKERATGSFVQIDNKLFNRKVGSNVLDRLADVTPGLIFNNGKGGAARLRIRGETTLDLQSGADVLIIVDNFPYEGDINNINPNDVENITVLKDAAASSIWGARAGNGVIVITTKRNRSANEPRIAFNANRTIGQKPDLFYQPLISSADFIDIEKMLFDRGFYTTYENSLNKVPLNPVVELLILKRDHSERGAELDREIEQMKNYDVRNDYEKYLYQAPVQQQYAFRVDGGNNSNRYYASFAYDKNRSEVVRNQGERFTATVGNTIALVKDKLELSGQAAFSLRKNENNGLSRVEYNSHRGIPSTALYPYARLADENGTPLEVAKNLRTVYLAEIADDGLLDWSYYPLLDRDKLDKTTKGNDLRLDTGLKYKLLKGINVQALYQYWTADSENLNLNSLESYAARHDINRLTKRDATTGDLSYPIPKASILDKNSSQSFAHNLRLQADLQLDIGAAHELNAILGYELRDQQMATFTSRLYGYNEKVGVSQSVDYKNYYSLYYNPSSTFNMVPYLDKETGTVDRFRSVFSNASYSYDKRYTVSGSLRFDESNLFGVQVNQKRVPLYSVGLAWHLANESFFQPAWVDKLSIRATYGKNGNVNRSLTAFTTISHYAQDRLTLSPYASIRTPRNPDLRWEKIATYNLAVDFSILKGRISGSADYYNKDGKDIISPLSFPGTAGIKTVTGNFGRTNARGFELVLNTMPIDKTIRWTNQLLLNTVKDKVVEYYGAPHAALNVMGSSDGTTAYPIAGKPLWALYSVPWGGLDPENGDPIGYLDGEPSKDYLQILQTVEVDELIYDGPVRPTIYGAFRNNLDWKRWSLSVNVSYRGGYYFKNPPFSYDSFLNGEVGVGKGHFEKRWQKKGDENITSIPSMPSKVISGRDGFYAHSSINRKKADHIRLQDIRLEYQLPLTKWGLSTLKTASIYAYANNLGLLWKKSDTEYDPDYANVDYLPVRTWSLGMNLTL